MILSNDKFIEGTYTFWQGENQLSGAGGQMGGGRGPMNAEVSKEFAISANGNYYSNVAL